MEIAASAVALVEFTSKLVISLAKFTHEAKSVDATTSELFDQVSSLESILKNVHKMLKRREAQRSNIPIEDPEIGIWEWARAILLRCERTVKNLENELRCLDNGKSGGWTERALKQLKLNINTPAIARIEKQIAANVSSAQLMMACFQAFTHEETQTTLNRGVEDLANAIEVIRADIAKLSHQKSNLPITAGHGNPLRSTASDNSVQIASNSDDDDLVDVELMKDDAKFASSLADRLSVSGGSVTGTKTPLTYRSVLKDAEGGDKIDIGGRVALIDPGYDSRVKHKPVESTSNEQRNTSRVNHSDVVVLDITRPPEILSALIDRCREEAQAAYKARDYPLAEKHLLEAILHNENRDKDGTFPFEDWSELRQFLAEIMSKNLKFDEAANEYRALIVAAEDNHIRKASLCFALAAMYRAQSIHSGNKEALKKMEEYAMHTFNSALRLSQQEGSLQWPSGHPSLQETAQLLVDMFEGTERLNEARTYRDMFLMTSKTVTPVSPSPHSTPESSREIPMPSTMPSSHLPAGQPQLVTDSTPTTSDSNHNNLQLPTPQTSSVSSVSNYSEGFGQRRIDRSSVSQSVSTAVSNDLVKYIRRGDCGVLGLILDTYNNIEARDENNLTPLLLACKEKKKDIVRFLLERNDGPNLSAQDDEGCTCLHLAIIGTDNGIGNDIVNLLIKHGADVNTPTAEDFEQMTPLHYAVRHNKLQSARALLDAGADKEALDSIGRTPLALALKLRRREDICCLLIRRGARYDRDAALRDFDDLDFALADWDRRHSGGGGSQWTGGGAVAKPKKRGSTASADSVASEVSIVSKFTNKFSLSRSRRRSSGNKARKDSSLS